jgi:maltose O-acetyltransferase
MNLKSSIIKIIFVKFRIWKYILLSECQNVMGKPISVQPLLLNGKGTIIFDTDCKFGYQDSPSFYNTYCYIEARNCDTIISFGKNNYFNNNCKIEANTKIEFGNDNLIGVNCSFLDNDGHHLSIDKRKSGAPVSIPIKIGNNVFIGDNVTILKGVSIGDNSVIGNGSLVTKSIPSNVIAAGNPAKVIRKLN